MGAVVFIVCWMVPIMTAQAETPDALPPSLVTMQSRYDFATTVARLKEALAARGITLFADIDQSAAAVQAGTSLRPTRFLLFGNPKSGTPIMAASPHAALELPLKAVVWEDEQQHVHIDYQDVTRTLAQYQVSAQLLAPMQPMPALLRAVAGQQQ
jgi:uncharacterized protein (DUF302 family)